MAGLAGRPGLQLKLHQMRPLGLQPLHECALTIFGIPADFTSLLPVGSDEGLDC